MNRAVFFHTVKEAINSCRFRDTDYTAEEIWEIIEDNRGYCLIGETDSVPGTSGTAKSVEPAAAAPPTRKRPRKLRR